jgi:hypothetical protein
MPAAFWWFAGASAAFALIASAPFWLDRLVVNIRRSGIILFPEAVGVAVSLTRDPDQWELGSSYIKHQEIGSVHVDDGVARVCVHLEKERLIWKPNFVERRIIWDGWRTWRTRRIGAHLDRTLPS